MLKPISNLLLEFLERAKAKNNSSSASIKYKLFFNFLRNHGFPKELDKNVVKILKRLETEREYGTYPIINAKTELESLLRKWQEERKKRRRQNANKN